MLYLRRNIGDVKNCVIIERLKVAGNKELVKFCSKAQNQSKGKSLSSKK